MIKKQFSVRFDITISITKSIVRVYKETECLDHLQSERLVEMIYYQKDPTLVQEIKLELRSTFSIKKLERNPAIAHF